MAETRYQVPVTKYRQIVFAAKIAAVGIFAVGIEFFTRQELFVALALWALAIIISLWPVQIDISADEAIAPGAPGRQKAMHPLEEI